MLCRAPYRVIDSIVQLCINTRPAISIRSETSAASQRESSASDLHPYPGPRARISNRFDVLLFCIAAHVCTSESLTSTQQYFLDLQRATSHRELFLRPKPRTWLMPSHHRKKLESILGVLNAAVV
jgi:hypothetical protein